MSDFNELMNLAVRGFTDIEQLLDAFFGFLRTRTDFFHTQLTEQQLRQFGLNLSVNLKGFKQDHMRKVLTRVYEANLLQYREHNQPYLLPGWGAQPESAVPAQGTGGTSSTSADTPIQGTGGAVPPVRQKPVSVPSSTSIKQPGSLASRETATTDVVEKPSEPPVISDDYSISTFNGGRTAKYCWNQTFTDVTIEIVSREPLVSKDVKVHITSQGMELSIKGVEVIRGKFPHSVNSADSMWNIEDRRRIMVTLDKPRELWWKCLIEGDEEIDVTQIESVKRFDEFNSSEQHEMMNLMQKHKQKQKSGEPSPF